MHFEHLRVDRDAREVLEIRVGDEVFSGATVEWSSVARAERAWFFESLERALGVWLRTPASGGEWVLEGDAQAHTLRAPDGTAAPDWGALDATQRASIEDELSQMLEVIQGMLIILD